MSKFKVGDKVRLIQKISSTTLDGFYANLIGKVVEVQTIYSCHFAIINDPTPIKPGDSRLFLMDHFELAEDIFTKTDKNLVLLTTKEQIQDTRTSIYACCDMCGKKTYLTKTHKSWLCSSDLSANAFGKDVE